MDWDSSSACSSSDSDCASSEPAAPSVPKNSEATRRATAESYDNSAADFPFDFTSADVNDQADNDESDDADDRFDSASGSLSLTQTQMTRQIPTPLTKTANITSQSNSISIASVTAHASSPSAASAEAISIIHRGSLRRIVNPSEVHNNQTHSPSRHQKAEELSSLWPMYSITVALQSQNLSPLARSHHVDQYQIIFNRQQYEFCTRIFTLLDTDCQSYIGPECIRNFLYLHCPVVRRRDGAIAMFKQNKCHVNEDDPLSSPTIDQIWNIVICCDQKCLQAADTTTRIGIEGWMILCRLLALVYEQESHRRFASRHLQQMMRHKHGGGGFGRSGIINPNEVVVVVDNPPPGPPAPISIEALMQVERERGLSSTGDCIQGWPYCPLPLPALDLDHWLLPTVRDTALSFICQRRGTISIEPFSSSIEGGFILRFDRIGDSSKQSIVARRSYADFEWLNQILTSHKRPGHGHLCGRILPPFPTKKAFFVPSTSGNQCLQNEAGEKAIAAAKSGVGILASVAKSLWGSVSGVGPSSASPMSQSHSATASIVESVPGFWAESSKDDYTTIEVAHAIERYLNYLSENEAFATSFPINAILQGSQTGLESAKQVLQDHLKQKKKERKVNQNPVLPESKLSSASAIYNALARTRASSIALFQDEDDTPWLRAAAQVAMALQFHGILETTGYESTSARIQHASLPKFNNTKNSWDDEDNADSSMSCRKQEDNSRGNVACFETGVVKIESELNSEEDMGYDLLPLPGPSDEQSVLNAGTSVLDTGGTCTTDGTRQFIYRMATDEEHYAGDRFATIGAMNVETEIEKVRDVIKTVDHTLGKLYSASLIVQGAQYERNAFQKSLLSGIDAWCGSCGEIISQRALVSGVAEVSIANANSESSCKQLSNDLSWQSSLSASAVIATTEVRDAFKASRTASRAKTAALAAAEKAKESYESCDNSSSKEEIQSSQANAFATQSHAIHATVVEYEANLSLKRASVSLVHDVKYWNVHRRKDLLQTCIEFAKSQRDACKKASDAWVGLRDGLIDSECTPLTTVGFDSLVNQVTSDPQNELSNLIESGGGLQISTESDVNSSVMSIPSSQSDVVALKGTQDDNIYNDTSPEVLNVDYDYFTYRQDNVHDYSSEEFCDSIAAEKEDFCPSSHTGKDESNDSHTFCDEVHESIDYPGTDARSMGSSTSMESLIDGLMTWGEDDRPDNVEASLFE